MRVIANFTLKSLRANRVRTFVTILGVALAAALLTAVMTSFTSLNGFLYDSEEQTSGNWMAKVHSNSAQNIRDQIAFAENEPDVTGIASIEDIGFGQLSTKQQNKLGKYLPISSYSGDIEKLCAIKIAEGRLPENPNEITLSDLWRIQGDVKIGDKLTIDVGERQAVTAKGKKNENSEGSNLSPENDPDSENDLDDESPTYSDSLKAGSILDSTIGYLEADADGGDLNEKLVDLKTRTYTVVGFSDPYNFALSTNVGQMGLIGSSSKTDGPVSAYVAFSNMATTDDVEKRAEELFPNEEINYHTYLLRYLGIRGGGAIWDTFFGLAAVLALVIVVACISLIYNAFAISVTERSSQFGLLASIGASRRQLRKAVLVEGIVIAAIGIPLGILIGIGGCAITFLFVGPMISSVFSNGLVDFKTSIAPWALILSAVLTLVTVLVSVFIPAMRTGRISPIDALKQNRSGAVSKRGLKDARTSTSVKKLWRRRGTTSRLFGIGGLIAHINSKRNKSKGRAASVSLALAIVLLMTAGSFSSFVGNLISTVDGNVKYDIGVNAQLRQDKAIDEDELDFYNDAYDAMSATTGADGLGYYLSDTLPVVISQDMIDKKLLDDIDESNYIGHRADGTIGALSAVYYLDDETFNAYAESLGADPDQYRDPKNPRAIAVDETYSTSNGKYQKTKMFSSTGDMLALAGGEIDGKKIDGYEWYVGSDKSGDTTFEFVPYSMQDDLSVDLLDPETDGPLDLESIKTSNIDIDCLASSSPDIISQYSENIQIIMPLSTIIGSPIQPNSPIFTAAFDAESSGHTDVAEEIYDAFNEYSRNLDPEKLVFFSINDYLGESEGNHMLATIISIFCLLFTVILTLIAMANVFNTMTNGLILRRREFAVMRSIGLSNKQFKSMIAEECVGYGIRGLVPGLIASVIVSYLLYRMISLSMTGTDFALPWEYLFIAIALTFISMLASVAYGMHKCKADNVVEALRADNV